MVKKIKDSKFPLEHLLKLSTKSQFQVIIELSKYEKADIKHLLIQILSFLESVAKIEDKKDHLEDLKRLIYNLIYIVIRSGDTDMLDLLTDGKPGNYFTSRKEELDAFVSRAYKELKILKNVKLKEIMEIRVTELLLNLRFFADAEGTETAYTHDDIFNRISFVSKCIDAFNTEPASIECKGKTIITARYIVQNIFTLKRLLKYTYKRIPWEEMEFCLISFISNLSNYQNVFNCIITRKELLMYLVTFSKCLANETKNIREMSIEDLRKLPSAKREKVKKNIVENYPLFGELYQNYELMRDAYSLQVITKYVTLAATVEPTEKSGQVVIIRALQVIGECLKNSLDSPKLSNTITDIVLLLLPYNVNQIIINLRNSFSHGLSLFKYQDSQELDKLEFFIDVQTDLKKILSGLTSFLYRVKIKIMRSLSEQILNSNDVVEMTNKFEICRHFILNGIITLNIPITDDLVEIEQLVLQLEETIRDKTYSEKNIFKCIKEIIIDEKADFVALRDKFKTVPFYPVELVHKNCIKLKEQANLILMHLPKQVNTFKFELVAHLVMMIWEYSSSRIKNRKFLFDVSQLVAEIVWSIRFESRNAKYLEKLDEVLQKRKLKFTQTKEDESCMNTIYKESVESLKLILAKYNLNSNLEENVLSFKNDAKLQAEVEMYVLAILSILDDIKHNLTNDLLFLDYNFPFLTGKNLRNHLAHGNVLNDVLFDSTMAILLNAKIISSTNVTEMGMKIGKIFKRIENFVTNFDRDVDCVNCQSQLFIALSTGSLEKVEYWVNKGADINGRDNELMTTLHYAAKSSNLDCLKFLLSHGLNINQKDIKNRSVLHVAAAYGRTKIVEFLIQERMMCTEDIDVWGKKPLHFAALNGHTEVVKTFQFSNANFNDQKTLAMPYAIFENCEKMVYLLLENEKNVDSIKLFRCFTLLHIAAQNGNLAITKYLLDKGANINKKSDDGFTPLYLSAFFGHSAVVTLLVSKGANVNDKSFEGEIPLDGAVKNGHEDVAKILLKHDSVINEPDILNGLSNEYGTLCLAVIRGDLNIVKLLIRYKANINIRMAYEITLLHLASVTCNKDIARILIENKAQVNVEDRFGFTPLIHSIRYKSNEIMKLLIEYGADCNMKNRCGLTPLHIAAKYGNLEAAQYLLSKGVDIFCVDEDENTALHLCCYSNSPSANIIFNLPVEAELNHPNVESEKLKILELLIDGGALLESKNRHGHTLLHTCSIMSSNLYADYLLSKSGNICAQDKFKCTPFHYAVQSNNLDLVEKFLENDCTQFINLTEINGKTALCIAVEHNYLKVTRLLIQKGANVNTGEPLVRAVGKGFKKIVAIFLKHKNINILNQFDKHDTTITEMAVRFGHAHILNYLLAEERKLPNLIKGVQKSIEGEPKLLFYASVQGYDDVVEFLLKNGAKADVKYSGFSPLYMAIKQGHIKILKVLVKYLGDRNLLNDSYNNPLTVSLVQNHVDIEFFLNYGKSNTINYDYKGLALLHIAAQFGHLEIVKYLVNFGADYYLGNTSQEKPIHFAASEGHLNIVDYLLSCNVPIDIEGLDSWSLLHYATQDGHFEMAKYLIKKGIDVNHQDANGCRPIHIASFHKHFEIVKLLINNGAFFNCTDNSGFTPLNICENEKIIQLLILIERLFFAVKQNKPSIVEECIQNGVIVNAKNLRNESVLHHASWKGYITIVEILLANKCNPNITGKNDCMPLHYASKFNNYEIVKALLENGAIYDSVCNGKTPTEFATQENILELLKLISDCFESVKNDERSLIVKLKSIMNTDLIKAVMNARNTNNNTVITEAICKGFNMEEIHQIFPDDICLSECPDLKNESKIIYQETYNSLITKHVTESKYLISSTEQCVEKYDDHSELLSSKRIKDCINIRSKWNLQGHHLFLEAIMSRGYTQKKLKHLSSFSYMQKKDL